MKETKEPMNGNADATVQFMHPHPRVECLPQGTPY